MRNTKLDLQQVANTWTSKHQHQLSRTYTVMMFIFPPSRRKFTPGQYLPMAIIKIDRNNYAKVSAQEESYPRFGSV